MNTLSFSRNYHRKKQSMSRASTNPAKSYYVKTIRQVVRITNLLSRKSARIQGKDIKRGKDVTFESQQCYLLWQQVEFAKKTIIV